MNLRTIKKHREPVKGCPQTDGKELPELTARMQIELRPQPDSKELPRNVDLSLTTRSMPCKANALN